MFPLPAQLAPPPALVALSKEAQKDAARQRASIAADELGCAPDTFAPFDHEGNSDVLFTCMRGSEKLILKAHFGDPKTLAGWREPRYASLAAQHKLGAPTYPIQSVPAVMASKFLQGTHPSVAELRKSDLGLVALCHDLHEKISMADADVAPKSNRNDFLAGAYDELAKSEVREILGEKGTESLYSRMDWLQSQLDSMPYDQKFIHGDIHAENLIQEDGSLFIIDWGSARSDDPLFDLVRMSFTLRTTNSRLLKYLHHYAALSGREPTEQEKQRILLQQAVNNIRWYLIWLKDAGSNNYKTQGMVTRLLDDDRYLTEMPRVALPVDDFLQHHVGAFAKNIEEARELARFFVNSMLPPGAEVDEPFPEHKNHFGYFRVTGGNQNWFVKVRFGAQNVSPWAEPAWMAWAADEGFAPQVQPSSGIGAFSDVLASEWIAGGHLDAVTANMPQVRRAVLEQMRRLHAMPAPLHLVPAAPEGAPSYAGGAWNRLGDLEAAGIEEPLPLSYLRDLLSRVLSELDHTPVRQVICHRDTHPRNMFYSDGKVMFIDWDWAGWDDPMRDPARFFVLAGTPMAELRDGLSIYLGHAASEAELRHLQLIVLATEIDFYGANQADTYPTHRSVIGRARRIQQLATMLGLL